MHGSFEPQKNIEVFYEGERVGLYIPDFCIDGLKVILDLKAAPAITPLHKAQVISYPKVTDAALALTANLLYPDLSAALYKALHRVHFTLGPGFLHQVYRLEFHGHYLGQDECRLIIVKGRIAIAAFAKSTTEAHQQRLKRHLHTLGLQLGLLANFYSTRLHIQPVRIAV